MSEDELVQAHVYITGRVQGVNFRYYTRRRAYELDLTGWVRNIRDGRVEAVFQGNREQVDKILQWCGHGPPSARVDDIELTWQHQMETFSGFEIRYWSG